MQALGCPRNLGGPVISVWQIPGGGTRKPSSRLMVGCACSTMRAKEAGTGAVSEGEGNEARGDGCQGVGAPNITDEAGEPTRRDPVEGRGRHSNGIFGWKDAGNIET